MLRAIIIIVAMLNAFLAVLHSSLSETNGEKILAREYNVPMSEIPCISVDVRYLFIPHTTYYITTTMGKDVTLATSYFGIVVFNEDNIDKYLGLNSIRDELKSRGFYKWAK